MTYSLPVVDTIHFFIILFRQGTHVIFTQMVSTNDELINSAIQIPNMLPMIEIHQDFRIDMEIYCMVGRLLSCYMGTSVVNKTVFLRYEWHI